jgi:CDP-4-dehydro-6-deoxyglucose reductase, E1
MNKHLKQSIISEFHSQHGKKQFVPGKSPVPVSGKVYDQHEVLLGVEAVMDGWWTEGRFAKKFEQKLGKYLGVRHISLVNSGSSANLVALTSLTSKMLGNRALKSGDEVITVATGFPTTINPILQNRLIPVIIDNNLKTKNATMEGIKKALSPKTKAIMMAHTLGNILPLKEILELAHDNNLWFVEDCCDGLGGEYQGKKVGSFGHIATFSFYPAHQITMGEGGAVVTNNAMLHRSIRQFRDWGRDCWCDTGRDDTCGQRFRWKLGTLPLGYDHKYIYSQIGYNLKLTDTQAAIGLAQLAKLPKFVRARMKNFQTYYDFFRQYPDIFILPEWEKEAVPCWFGFCVVVTSGANFTKLELVQYLESHHIATRSLFAGNILRHPAYMGRTDMRVVGEMKNSDLIADNGFWIGVYPGITDTMTSYVCHTISEFIRHRE